MGLYDVHGNVWEWVKDCRHKDYEGAPEDGSKARGEDDGGNCSRRIHRGGSWDYEPEYMRSANRNWDNTDFRNDFIGFRLAQDL